VNSAINTLTPPPLRLEPVASTKSFPALDHIRWVPGEAVLIVPARGAGWHACQSCHERPGGRLALYQSSTDASVTLGPLSHSWLPPPSYDPATFREAPDGIGKPSREVTIGVGVGVGAAEPDGEATHPDNTATQAIRTGTVAALRCRIYP
jgi:hypothetical protein